MFLPVHRMSAIYHFTSVQLLWQNKELSKSSLKQKTDNAANAQQNIIFSNIK